MSDDTKQTYSFRFGVYGSNITPIAGTVDYFPCPWELKHVDSITVSVSGSSATMGIPNKPASRTQIFDTQGCVRTFKITGRRYDQEEQISNWDFLNTQFNIAPDDVLGTPSGNQDGYCYIGLNWMLSCMQILLKGYVFYIENTDTTDERFIFNDSTQNPPDEGYNVALTQVSATFSENEPGLLEYSLTFVERFKRGDCIYRTYLEESP